MRVQQLDVQAESKTRDNVFVNVVVSVQVCLLATCQCPDAGPASGGGATLHCCACF